MIPTFVDVERLRPFGDSETQHRKLHAIDAPLGSVRLLRQQGPHPAQTPQRSAAGEQLVRRSQPDAQLRDLALER